MKKICFRCKKGIEEGTPHYDFIEYLEGKVVKIDSAHKFCWDDFLKQIKDVSEAKKMLRGIKPFLQNMGLLKEEEIIIK